MPAGVQSIQKSLGAQKVAAYVGMAQRSESLWGAILVFLGTLMLLSTIPFYPVYLAFILAALCGLVSVRSPPVGVIAGVLLGLPAVAYQSAVFAWFYLLVIVAVLFEAFEGWLLIAVLEILVLAPFAFRGLAFSGYITIIGMGMGALFFGSRKSLAISLSWVTLILLLSSIWLTQNTAYMPIKMDIYKPGKAELQLAMPEVGLWDVVPQIGASLARIVDFSNMARIWESLGWIAGNAVYLLASDSLALQIIAWGIALYLAGYVSGRVKRRPQLMASLCLLIALPAYYLISILYGTPFRIEFAGAVAAAIVVLGGLEQAGVNISREFEIEQKEKMKAYGKFGMSDMSVGGAERSMDDVGGYEDVKQELREAILLPLQKKELAYAYGLTVPKGILLFGPPGTGKTMLMRALAKELKYNFIEVRCSQILSQWYGESEKNVAEVFTNARKAAPTILFFDEIDSVAKKRTSMAEGLDTVGPRVLTTLLQEMDGAVKSNKVVMVVGATNLPSELDPAILRPGRFDKIIYMHLPDPEARKAVFRVHLRKLTLAPDVDLDVLAKRSERFSGADIKNIVEEAKKLTAREAIAKGEIVPISMGQLLTVISRVKPSTSLAQLETYEQFKTDFERRTGGVKAVEEEAEKEGAVKWGDVIGLDEVKRALLEAIELPLLHADEMKEFKVKPSKGILLFGPPGTGKTLIVRAAAGELKASFQTISAAELVKKGYSQAVTVIREAFNRARENPPGIIFVDEIETFAPARGMTGSSEILGQFLTEMDGIKGQKGVVVIGATNKPSLMDAAIMRPGRFDKIFYVPPPGAKGRADMFRLYLGNFAGNADCNALATAADGFSGADIASVCQSVKMEALRAKIAKKEMAVTTQLVLDVIRTRRPSITRALLEEYQEFLEAYGERK